MSQKCGIRIALVLMISLGSVALAHAQCKNQITLVPLTTQKSANKVRDFDRFRYSLSVSDTLIIRSHEDTGTSIGPYDTGFVITRDGKALQRISLRELPEMHGEPDFADSFTTLAVTRACGSGSSIFFVTMQYMGDLTSPALLFVLVASEHGYEVSALPTISGGVFEISRVNPFHIRTWDTLHEGECNACKTAYQVTEYEIRNGKPVQIRRYRTRSQYSSVDFDDRRRIRFIP